MNQPRFLPMSRSEMDALGWDSLDVLLVSGDAYVDHPSFGAALLGRLLLSLGYRTGIVAQPRWQDGKQALADISGMGRPLLFAGVTAGALDSMLAHYTAFRKKRSDDAYTPGGQAGARPNRAVIVYSSLVRQAFPGIPLVLGGIEASLRRITHYDFWSDALRRPILLDSKADLLVYGMGEKALAAIAERAAALSTGSPLTARAELVRACADIPGLVRAVSPEDLPQGPDVAALPSHEELLEERSLLMRATLELERRMHQGGGILTQRVGDRYIVVHPPAPGLREEEMDALYSLPFSRLPHPAYSRPIPAWEMIRTSITTHRGCGGGCSFCSLALHQGRRISSRSEESILTEARNIAKGPFFREEKASPPRWAGAISDVGGPSANMWQARCGLPEGRQCGRDSCLHPALCPFFLMDQRAGARMLRGVARQEGVRHVRIASGVRYDLALKEPEALQAYAVDFTGGQLKVAPEHSEESVLQLMRKPSLEVFESFLDFFARSTGQSKKDLYTVPYLMSAFPGCTEEHMKRLADWLRAKRWKPQQVQCFIPTPGTVATAMFYTGTAPDGSRLYVPRTDKERLRQHHILLGDDGREKARPGGEPRTEERRSAKHRLEERRSEGSRAGPRRKRKDAPGRKARD